MSHPQRMTRDEFADLMWRIAKGWSTGDADLAASCFTPDVIYVEPPDRQWYAGRAAVWELSGGDNPPAMSMTWHHLVFDEHANLGAGEYTFRGNSQYHGLVIVEVRAGLIRRWREYQYPSDLPWDRFVGESAFDAAAQGFAAGRGPTRRSGEPDRRTDQP
jgi:hypothetical protein